MKFCAQAQQVEPEAKPEPRLEAIEPVPMDNFNYLYKVCRLLFLV